MKKQVFVVTHTHWDREWYFSKATFQMMNADLMEHLLALLEQNNDMANFMLDGQLIALEDYIELCPDRAERIRALVISGRLAIGPWYVLPDEYLASGEAHIRNYLTGMRLAKEYGGGMRLGYLPDSFGHPSQIPQIIRGLGMQEHVFWRGTGPEVKHTEFWWLGKDGSQVLALNMHYGYSNAANLKEDQAVRHKRLDHEIGKLLPLSQINLALLMNGSDHIAPDARVPGWIREYQDARPELQITHGSLQDYVQEAHKRAENTALQRVSGELRSGYHAYLLGDTLSTRMPIKQRQRAVEVALEKHLEPLFALLEISGLMPYPFEKLRHLWKLALQNLPHDSICGCGNDSIHREMMQRYEQMDDIAAHLEDVVKKQLTGDITDPGADGALLVFSPSLMPRFTTVRAHVQSVLHPLRHVDYEQDQRLLEFDGEDVFRMPSALLLTDSKGSTVQGRVQGARVVDTVESRFMTQPYMNRVVEFDCVFSDELPPLSCKRYSYRFLYDLNEQEPGQLENEFLIMRPAMNGMLSLYHKQTRRWYHNLVCFDDLADVGDEYTFDGLHDDKGISMDESSVQITWASGSFTIDGMLALPVSCTADRRARAKQTVGCEVSIKAALLPGMDRVDVSVKINNRAKDHKLAVQIPLGKQAEEVLCDTLFAIENRPIIRDQHAQEYEGWMEQPNNSFFLKNFAALDTKGDGLAVFVKGLPQCEVAVGPTEDALKLTLMRCVGWLSRKDLNSRAGNGGWSVATPEAQLLGEHCFEFAIQPYAGLAPHNLYAKAVAFSEGALALQISRQGAPALGGDISALRVDDPRLALSAFKKAEDGKGHILRLVNLSSQQVQTALRLTKPTSVHEVNMAEEGSNPLGLGIDALPFTMRPWQVRTFRLS